MHQLKVQHLIGTLCLILALLMGTVSLAQEDEVTVLEPGVGLLGNVIIEVPSVMWLVDGNNFLTSSERLLPPEDRPRDYTTPDPETGEVWINFATFSPDSLVNTDFEFTDEATASELAEFYRTRMEDAIEDDKSVEIGEIAIVVIGESEVAVFTRNDTETAVTFLYMKFNPHVFLQASVHTFPGEYASFEQAVHDMLAGAKYESTIEPGHEPKPGRWAGSGSGISATFTVNADQTISDFVFQVRDVFGNSCTLRVDGLPVLEGILAGLERGFLRGEGNTISNLAVVGTFESDESLSGMYSYQLLCGTISTSPTTGNWTATWQSQ
jgi:hypothetical protein